MSGTVRKNSLASYSLPCASVLELDSLEAKISVEVSRESTKCVSPLRLNREHEITINTEGTGNACKPFPRNLVGIRRRQRKQNCMRSTIFGFSRELGGGLALVGNSVAETRWQISEE